MPDNYLPAADAAFQRWLNNFVTVSMANMTTLALSASDVTNLTGVQTNFATDVALQETSKAAAKAATTSKDVARKAANAEVRLLVRRFQSNPAVTTSLKDALNINPRNTPKTTTPPVTPGDLMATPDVNGVNNLTWNRNGNIANTNFIIEAAVGSATEFTQVGVTQKMKFAHTRQTVGVKVMYRVTAERADMMSLPTLPVVVYATPPMTTLTLQKAA